MKVYEIISAINEEIPVRIESDEGACLWTGTTESFFDSYGTKYAAKEVKRFSGNYSDGICIILRC